MIFSNPKHIYPSSIITIFYFLEVLPLHLNTHRFIRDQQTQEYNDLLRALNVMRIVNSNTPKHQIILAVWLLRTENLHFDINLDNDCSFSLIARCMINFYEDDVSVYWATKCFYEMIKKFEPDIPKLLEATWNLLEKEDTNLFKHFQQTRMLYSLPIERWFDSAFASVIHVSALARIWDKLCGGSCKILTFLTIVMLINQKQKLLKLDKVQDVMKCLQNISEESAEMIVTKAIDMWLQHGSPLTVYDKPKT